MERSPGHPHAVGARGEALAARVLERAGYAILERGWRCRLGEVDLIARDGDTVVFVEVKARGGMRFGRPSDAVGRAKRVRLGRLGLAYLARRGWLSRACRFDVVEVLERADAPPAVRHHIDAFRPTG